MLDLQTGAERGSLPYLLLDDVPGATLVSGFAMTVAADRGDAELEEFRTRMAAGPRLQIADICAGWQTDGTLLNNLVDGRPPTLLGPVVALTVLEDDDPDAWHAYPRLPGDATRRARRIDVWRDDAVHVDVFFRDSVMAPDGVETVIHEYTVDVTVDPDTMTVVACSATPRVLPWRECPQAIGSAGGSSACAWPTSDPRCAPSSSAPAPAPTSMTSSAASKTSTGSPAPSPDARLRRSYVYDTYERRNLVRGEGSGVGQASSLAMTSSPKRLMPSMASFDVVNGCTITRSTPAAR